MSSDHLEQLHESATRLLNDPGVCEIIAALKDKTPDTDEPFVWSVISREKLPCELPANILSTWIFVLKAGRPSGNHFHPNSVQHMVVVEGQGRSRVGGESRQMLRIDSPNQPLEAIWYVIPAGIEHEFFPAQCDMVVLSFHTCWAHELVEISGETGRSRVYEAGTEPDN